MVLASSPRRPRRRKKRRTRKLRSRRRPRIRPIRTRSAGFPIRNSIHGEACAEARNPKRALKRGIRGWHFLRRQSLTSYAVSVALAHLGLGATAEAYHALG